MEAFFTNSSEKYVRLSRLDELIQTDVRRWFKDNPHCNRQFEDVAKLVRFYYGALWIDLNEMSDDYLKRYFQDKFIRQSNQLILTLNPLVKASMKSLDHHRYFVNYVIRYQATTVRKHFLLSLDEPFTP